MENNFKIYDEDIDTDDELELFSESESEDYEDIDIDDELELFSESDLEDYKEIPNLNI